MTCDTLPTFTFAIPSMADQIAAIVSADNFDVLSIFSVVLPTGETIERSIFDGTLYDGVTVSRGRVEMDVTPTGWPAFIAIGDLCVDDILEEELENISVFLENLATCFDDGEVSAEDWADLRALLSLDLVQLGTFAALPPDVESAIAAWYAARGGLRAD